MDTICKPRFALDFESKRRGCVRLLPPLSIRLALHRLGTILALVACVTACGQSSSGRTVVVSNVALPLDTRGNELLTGEASVLAWDGAFYVYFNDWGSCPGVDCCQSALGCSDCCFSPPTPQYPDTCVYAGGHQVVVYRTTDFQRWEPKGVALPIANRHAGIVFRPRVVYRASTHTFLMWYEDRWDGQTGYALAESATPEGPFVTVADTIELHGAGRIGDYDIFVDDDGTGYHVRTGLVVERLTSDLAGGSGEFYSLDQPVAEAPLLFKRNGIYYLLAGFDCCACVGGSNVLVYTADQPLGPYTYRGDVGSNATPFQLHVPDHFVTKAQGTDVIRVPAPDGSLQFLWLGNQWVTAVGPGRPRDHDLLYWSVLHFDDAGGIEHFDHADSAALALR